MTGEEAYWAGLGPDEEDYDWSEYADSYCYECGGRGWFIDCIDDLCHGQDCCIHGDPPRPCRVCNPKGEKEDPYD
jgi:hypothetical protein